MYNAKVSVEAKHFECANIRKSVLLMSDWIKNPFTIYYCIQGNIGHRFVFAPFAFAGSWANSNTVYQTFLLKKVSERIQEEAKQFASVKRRKLHGMKITLYTVIDRQHCCVSFSVSYHH